VDWIHKSPTSLLVFFFSSKTKFHGLVVPHWVKWRGSSGQTPCPCSTCSTKSEDPLVLVPLVPRSSGDPLLPVPLLPLVSTCTICVIWEPLTTLFSQIFFWVSQYHSIFVKTLLTENFPSKFRRLYNCWRGEINNSRLRLHSK